MSIISKLKGGKKAADKQKEETKKTEEQKPAAAPYKHVPTHAASDALTASAAGKPEDQERIAEQNRARMSRTDSDMSGTLQMPLAKRSPSSLSNEWAPSQAAQGPTLGWQPTKDTNFSLPTPPVFVTPGSLMNHLPPVPPIPSRYSSTSLSAQSAVAGSSRTPQSRTSSYQGLNSALAQSRTSSFQSVPGTHAKMSAYRSHMGQGPSGRSPLSSHGWSYNATRGWAFTDIEQTTRQLTAKMARQGPRLPQVSL